MAWTDDRLWCHPKYVGLSWRAKAVLRHGFEYAAGMATKGHLDPGAQKVLGADAKTRAELIASGWWDVNGDGKAVVIHDWDDHNSKRDERREKERIRKREARWKNKTT